MTLVEAAMRKGRVGSSVASRVDRQVGGRKLTPCFASPKRERERVHASISTGNFISGRLVSRLRPARLSCPRSFFSFCPSDPFGILLRLLCPKISTLRRVDRCCPCLRSSFAFASLSCSLPSSHFLLPGCFSLRATRPTVKGKVWN